MRNLDISTSGICENLRSIAEKEAHEGEFRPHEHICWMAAERIEDLKSMVEDITDDDLIGILGHRLYVAREKNDVRS